MKNKKPLIRYTDRDFDSIKKSLIEHAKRFYPDQYNDFNDSSFGSMVFDAVAYVGDIMSFYLDFQVNESFLETALQYNNVRKIAEQMGYKYYGRPSSYGTATFYISVPSNILGSGPNTEYIPVLKKGSQFSAGSANFILLEDVDFNKNNIEQVASKFDDTTGKPSEYAFRSYGRVKSGARFTKQIPIGEPRKFLKVRVGPSIINEIETVYDTNGNRFYEVNYLTEDTVYLETTNPRAQQDGVPSIIKPKVVARRFTMEQDSSGTYLQFGYGSDDETVIKDVTDPSTVVLKKAGKGYITDDEFDPNELLNTDKFGVTPSNTTLTITYGANTQLNVSVGIGEINTVTDNIMEFPNTNDSSTVSFGLVKSSLEVSNDEIITANTAAPTTEELKYRAYACRAAQNRVVTRNDYEAYCYKMPPSLGSIKRVSIHNDPSGTNRRIAMYVISEDDSGFLTDTNISIKSNLKTWLQKSKMINDGIDIIDAHVINIGFSYEAVVDPNLNSLTVLADVDVRLRNLFTEKMYIAEPLYINQIYNTINKTRGVVDTVKVTLEVKKGAGYSSMPIDISDITSPDGSYIKTPKNCILELKYLDRDIKGASV